MVISAAPKLGRWTPRTQDPDIATTTTIGDDEDGPAAASDQVSRATRQGARSSGSPRASRGLHEGASHHWGLLA